MRQKRLVRPDAHLFEDHVQVNGVAHVVESVRLAQAVVARERNAGLEGEVPLEVGVESKQHADESLRA
eukprot:3047212-Pleurochrysis_carterae.AAC.1